jgi:hypothetical protein
MGESILPLSAILVFDFGIVPTVCYVMLFFVLQHNTVLSNLSSWAVNRLKYPSFFPEI